LRCVLAKAWAMNRNWSSAFREACLILYYEAPNLKLGHQSERNY
jgi:hypothetical protein